MSISGVGRVKINDILRAAAEQDIKVADLLSMDIKRPVFLNSDQHVAFIQKYSEFDIIYEKLIESNVSVIKITDEAYPQVLSHRLKKSAPPVLFAKGNFDLLKRSMVGFCGSRKASQKGLEAAKDCANQLAAKGVNVVSGYAAGVDQAVHVGALDVGGVTTAVIAEGILHFTIRKNLNELWDWSRVLVLSEFYPDKTWASYNAMQRNATIVGLSAAMVLIEAAEKSGSEHAGSLALKVGVPLFATVFNDMSNHASGNESLLRQGAIPLKKSQTTQRANVSNIYSALQGMSSVISEVRATLL